MNEWTIRYKVLFYEKFGFSANEAQRLKLMYQVR